MQKKRESTLTNNKALKNNYYKILKCCGQIKHSSTTYFRLQKKQWKILKFKLPEDIQLKKLYGHHILL